MTHWATRPKEKYTIRNNNSLKCQGHQIHSGSQQYFSTSQAQHFILTLIMSLGRAHLTMREGRRKKRGWMRGQDMRGRSSERNTTKKIKLRTREIFFSSHQLRIVIENSNNLRIVKRNSQRVSKSIYQEMVTTLALQNPKHHVKSSHNSNSVDDKNSESSVSSDNVRRQTRTWQFLYCSC